MEMVLILLIILVSSALAFLFYFLLLWTPSRRFLRKVVFKKIVAFMMNRLMPMYNRTMHSFKEKLFSSMGEGHQKGLVLEIGVGAGANLEFYPDGTQLVAVDPNEYFKAYLEENLRKNPGVSLHQFVIGKAENMDKIASSSMSCVVSTLVLCSVKNIDTVLKEIKRILKPGGRFYFLEHTAAIDENSWVHWIQLKIQPFWTVLTDGCSVTNKTWENIGNCGFSHIEIEKFDAPLGRHMFLVRPHIVGFAIK